MAVRVQLLGVVVKSRLREWVSTFLYEEVR